MLVFCNLLMALPSVQIQGCKFTGGCCCDCVGPRCATYSKEIVNMWHTELPKRPRQCTVLSCHEPHWIVAISHCLWQLPTRLNSTRVVFVFEDSKGKEPSVVAAASEVKSFWLQLAQTRKNGSKEAGEVRRGVASISDMTKKLSNLWCCKGWGWHERKRCPP